MKKILLLGGNGRVGRMIRNDLQNDYIFESPSSSELDITDFSIVEKFISESNPEVIINCVMAPVSVDDAEKVENRNLVFETNAEAAGNLAEIAEKIGSQYIYFGTSYVFDGRLKGRGYTENDERNPISVYGRSKAEGEVLSLKNCHKTVVVRIEMPYSPVTEGTNDIVKTFLNMLKEGKEVNALEDQFCTPTFIPDIAKAIKNLVQSESLGIWHVAGDQVTPFGLAKLIAQMGGFDNSLVKPISFVDYKRAAQRPKNSSLDTSKYREKFGVIFTPIRLGLEKFFENINDE